MLHASWPIRRSHAPRPAAWPLGPCLGSRLGSRLGSILGSILHRRFESAQFFIGAISNFADYVPKQSLDNSA